MTSILKFILPFILIIAFNIQAQELQDSEEQQHIHLSRYRLQMGYVDLIKQNFDFKFKQYFLNINFRASGFDDSSKIFKVKMSSEIGSNFMLNKDESWFIFSPYAKFGPEIKLSNDIFLAGSLGLVAASAFGKFVPFPFWGVNSFYLTPMPRPY